MTAVEGHTTRIVKHDDSDSNSSSRRDFPTIFSPSATYAAAYSRPEFLSPKFCSPTPSVYGDEGPGFGYGYDEADSLPDMDHLQSTFTQRGFMSPYSYPHSFASSRAPSPLNLGAESPSSIMNPAMTPVYPLTPTKSDLCWQWPAGGGDLMRPGMGSRSASFQRAVTCGICFQQPSNPRRMRCCGSVFCLDHISNWLYRASSDAHCPTCEQSPFASTAQSPSLPPRPFLRDITTAPEYDSDFSCSDPELDLDCLSDVTDSDSVLITPVSQHDAQKSDILGRWAESVQERSPEEQRLLEQVTPESLAMGRVITISVFLVAVAGFVNWS